MTRRKPVGAPQVVAPAPTAGAVVPDTLLKDLRQLIEPARQPAAAAVNAGLTMMYWRICQRIRTDVLGGQRAGYGEQIVATLSRQLASDYGRGFREGNLRRMVQFAELFPPREIVVSLMRHLSWTHFLALLPVKGPVARIGAERADLAAPGARRGRRAKGFA